jgi:GNAT superfamily N-acetyltransferase
MTSKKNEVILIEVKNNEQWWRVITMNEKNDFYSYKSMKRVLPPSMTRDEYIRMHTDLLKGGVEKNADYYKNYLVSIYGVGIVGWISIKDKSIANNWTWLNMLLIDKEYRGRGYGTQVLEVFEQHAKDMGKYYCVIDIDIHKQQNQNNLLKWYVRNGYNFDSVEDGQFFMKKDLNCD